MRICLFGEGPLCDAVEAALEAQGHTLLGPYATPQPTDVLRSTQASVGLSAGYRHKLTEAEWSCFPDGILNIHTGYLPWNKGAYPNVWPILDGSPAGVTLHRVDAGIDTGPIVAQTRVTVEPWDTAHTLYERLLAAGVELVAQAVRWAEYDRVECRGWPPGTPQDHNAGSRHFKKDWAEEMKCFDADCYACGALKWLRAASFPGYGLRYRQDGKLLEATISIREVTE